MLQLPTLYAKSSNNKTKFWSIEAVEVEGAGHIRIRYGYVGQEEDKIQTTLREITSGKNLGKANETTPFQQACMEAQSMWEKKKDKLYVEDPSGVAVGILPMLAQDYSERSHDIVWPAFIQPKLEGMRCLARKTGPGEVVFYSRAGKVFKNLNHLVPYLDRVMDVGSWLDGELFNKDLTFQQISSAVKKAGPFTPLIQFWVYDCVIQEMAYKDRQLILANCIPTEGPVRLLETYKAASEAEMKVLHDKFVQEGYEGTIIRNEHGLYIINFRSSDLQKYKDWIDDEFVIVGGKEGTGKDKGTVIFICATNNGQTFDARPKGSHLQRTEWFNNLPQLIGKKLTVRFQRYTDEGKVYLPRGIMVDRDSYE